MRQTEQVAEVLMVTGVVAGGVGRHVEQVIAGLIRAGHQVVVACPAVVARRFALEQSGAKVIVSEVGRRPAPHRDRAVIATLREVMPTVDVVHAHGVRAGALCVAARGRGLRSHPRLVVTHHNAAPEGRLAAVVHRGLERIVARGADHVLAVSPDLRDRLSELGAPDVGLAVVPATRRADGGDRRQIRADLAVAPESPLVVAVGRLSPQKGFDRLLDAVAIGAPQVPGLAVLVAGTGPQEHALQRRIDRERLPVRLLGHRDDVPELLHVADVAVSAARWEGQPVWLQEALHAGVPIVATDVGGTGSVLDGAGRLVREDAPSELPAALAEQLVQVLTDAGLAGELAQASSARARRLPTDDDAVEAVLVAYGRGAST